MRTPLNFRDATHVHGCGPERHAVHVEKAFGDWYAVCSCKARSLPSWCAQAATEWRCPRHEAEMAVEKADVRWAQRVADAGELARA